MSVSLLALLSHIVLISHIRKKRDRAQPVHMMDIFVQESDLTVFKQLTYVIEYYSYSTEKDHFVAKRHVRLIKCWNVKILLLTFGFPNLETIHKVGMCNGWVIFWLKKLGLAVVGREV